MMTQRNFTKTTGWILCLGIGAFLAGCGGNGSGSSSGGLSGFFVQTITVDELAIWQLNRPIDIRFSQPVDFSSVNLNTIQVFQLGGAPTTGEFHFGTLPGSSTIDPQRILFNPRCPTLSDYSDGGLLPGGIEYVVNIVASSSGGPTVRSSSAEPITTGLTRHFFTPNSTDPAVLFIDTAVGPPAPIIRPDSSVLNACYLELGGSTAVADRVYFQPRAIADPELGADVPSGFKAPLNLYSDASTDLAVVLVINQAVDPAASNISPNTITLEYKEGSSWKPVSHLVSLVANCTAAGALVRITPQGILPQGRKVRVQFTSDFRDVVGQINLVNLTVGAFDVSIATDPGTNTPGLGVDELRDEFTAGASSSTSSLEDVTTGLTTPRAVWGDNGTLKAAFAFDGTGGPGGTFDWVIGNPSTAAPTQSVFLDTTFSLITNSDHTATEAVVNGRVDVRNITIYFGSQVVVSGPNPCKILASGQINILGRILITGASNKGVVTLNTTNIPEVGAAGQAGGGRGGAGSYLTTQSTPAGQAGYGFMQTPNAGGGGGESGYNASTNDDLRRPGGGGGGSLGADQLLPTPNPNNCPEQSVIGLDVEKGFPGSPAATGALSGVHPPSGGTKGPRPFIDNNPNNDFYGTMLTQTGQVIAGELTTPWAGAGGGAGGNACMTASFPTTPFDINGDEKGCGGGGGGGSLTILSLGDIILGPAGRIDASGGTGGGGENSQSGGITRIGGGSGGGSGGHIILQTASRIDLTACKSTAQGNPAKPGGIYALGGQGGAGQGDLGGAQANGTPTQPFADALPQNSYPSPGAPCAVVGNTVGNADPVSVVQCCGGDGGPGMIQLHTQNLTDIRVPTTAGENIFKIIKPVPVGSTPNNANTPAQWNQLLPIFGRFSTALSQWIPLGAATVDPVSPTPNPVIFSFGGTATATGLVNTTGSGTSAQVAALAPALTGTIAANPAVPYITADKRTVVFDATTMDDIYKRNALLMKRFVLKMVQGGTANSFEVVSAAFDVALNQMRVTVDTVGAPLMIYVAGDTASVIPRFFRVITSSVGDALPASSSIKFEFQAAPATIAGGVDTQIGSSHASDWVTDITLLNTHANAANFKFLRFRVKFDILADGSTLTFQTPIPAVDFLRIPFKF